MGMSETSLMTKMAILATMKDKVDKINVRAFFWASNESMGKIFKNKFDN